MNSMKMKRGFIKTILIIVIALVALGFFGYNLRDIIDSPDVRDNLFYAWSIIVKIFKLIILTPVLWLSDRFQGLLK